MDARMPRRVHGWTSVARGHDGRVPRRSGRPGAARATDGESDQAMDGRERRLVSTRRWSMELGIRGKFALVCAGSKGLGRACAAALSAEGARVAICARDGDILSRAAAEIAAATGNPVLPIRADLTRDGDIDALFAAIGST